MRLSFYSVCSSFNVTDLLRLSFAAACLTGAQCIGGGDLCYNITAIETYFNDPKTLELYGVPAGRRRANPRRCSLMTQHTSGSAVSWCWLCIHSALTLMVAGG